MNERTRVLWGGTSGGIISVHEWLFSEAPAGVRVVTTESFAGEPVETHTPHFRGSSTCPSWPGSYLKAAAESPT